MLRVYRKSRKKQKDNCPATKYLGTLCAISTSPQQKSCQWLKSPSDDGNNIRTTLFSFPSQNNQDRIIKREEDKCDKDMMINLLLKEGKRHTKCV